MAFCKTCGAQIPDGMTQCASCAAQNDAVSGQQQAAAPNNTVFNQQQAAAPFSPSDNGGNMGAYNPDTAVGGDFNASFVPENNKSNSKKGFIVLGIAAVVLIALLIFLFNIFFGGYKKPIKNAVKGINKVDIDKVAHAVIPKKQFNDFKDIVEDETGNSYKEAVKDLEDEINDTLKDTKLDYKVKVDFKGKKKVSGGTCDDIEDMANMVFEEMELDEVEVKKAYRVKVKLEAEAEYEKEEVSAGATFNIYVVKYKGCSGWYLAPYADEDSFGGWLDLAKDLGGYGGLGGFDLDDLYDDDDYDDYDDYFDF